MRQLIDILTTDLVVWFEDGFFLTKILFVLLHFWSTLIYQRSIRSSHLEQGLLIESIIPTSEEMVVIVATGDSLTKHGLQPCNWLTSSNVLLELLIMLIYKGIVMQSVLKNARRIMKNSMKKHYDLLSTTDDHDSKKSRRTKIDTSTVRKFRTWYVWIDWQKTQFVFWFS